MDVKLYESKIAMDLLKSLPEEYPALNSSFDVLDSNENELGWKHVKARVLQEEQRINMRIKSAPDKSETVVVSNHNHDSSAGYCKNCGSHPRNRPFCNHFKRLGNVESKC